MTPVLHTPRLRMRGWRLADFEPFAALYASDRARLIGGPVERRHAWRTMAMLAGEWTLRGYGMWSVETAEGKEWAGHVGFFHPDHYDEPELGWALAGTAEGKGYAEEAARAALNWGRGNGIPAPISNVDAANTRSIRLVERLGAALERTQTDPDDGHSWHVYRHPRGKA